MLIKYKKYQKFIYENYSYRVSKNNLEIFFNFKIEPDIYFHPKIIIENIDKKRLKQISDRELNSLIFHLGLVEIPSYWKATCSPEIEIQAACLNQKQIKWWKDLIIKGLGQFFYENKIDWRPSNFLKIIATGGHSTGGHRMSTLTGGHRMSTLSGGHRMSTLTTLNRYLVPLGGGKDSIVTLQKLKEQKKKISCFLVNPTKAAQNVVKVSGIKDLVIVKRTIDLTLLELNKRGYLNGHTPITAVLSFLSVFCAVLFNYKYIAFSNEKSADEGNVKYLGKMINHQWSKSSEFEKKFRFYIKKYLRSQVDYFSFLRKYTELEIARMFTKYPKYFPVFSSCNAGMRIRPASAKSSGEARWCGNCPKCLFVYATLYPFLTKKQLLKIFGKNIFENKKLLPIMRQLIGDSGHKPFECVGTKKESRLAFKLCLKKARKSGKIPYLLTKI